MQHGNAGLRSPPSNKKPGKGQQPDASSRAAERQATEVGYISSWHAALCHVHAPSQKRCNHACLLQDVEMEDGNEPIAAGATASAEPAVLASLTESRQHKPAPSNIVTCWDDRAVGSQAQQLASMRGASSARAAHWSERQCCKHMCVGKSCIHAAAQPIDPALQTQALLSVGTAKCCLQCQSPATAQLCLKML